MKTKLFFILMLCWAGANCQTVDTTTYEYCEVVAITKNQSFIGFVDAVNVFINFGEGKTYTPEKPMKDDNGNLLMWTSHIDCINYMATKGWKVTTATAYFISGAMNWRAASHYVMSRPKYLIRKADEKK